MPYINDQKRLEIERKVQGIKLGTGLSYPENSLVDIANSLGAEVLSADLPPLEGKRVKGFIQWLPDEKRGESPYSAKIYLNKNQSSTTRTFTLAHELGHFLLHKDNNNFRIDLEDYATDDSYNQETEANYFAGEILMPKEKFISVLKNAGNLDNVAEAFGVSVPAVGARMKWLRIAVS